MSKYTFKLTEEIARYAFEVKIRNSEWFLAFTNPTAGPWKKITASNLNGEIGEVYRFARDEERPDLLLVHDREKIVLILEAKDSLPKLITGKQLKKSAKVVLELARTLRGLKENEFWSHRTNYTILAGLLWGSEKRSKIRDVDEAIERFANALQREEKGDPIVSPVIIGIESYKDNKGGITCFGHVSRHEKLTQIDGKRLLQTLPVLTELP